MKTTSWEQTAAILRAIGSALSANVTALSSKAGKALTLATTAAQDAAQAKQTATAAEAAAAAKVDKNNPTATGAFSMNRLAGSTTGAKSHTEGMDCAAMNQYSHAEGYKTAAKGRSAHSEGEETMATGVGAHAEGFNSQATGTYSHAQGSYAIASAQNSHAEGRSTTAASQNQHVQGRYNVKDDAGVYAHIVGNGAFGTLSNAHTLDWDGNAWFAGNIEGAGVILTAPGGTRWRITVADDGTLSAVAQ